ncbi:unnamed protein product, partial [Closterium sp. NIES-54]
MGRPEQSRCDGTRRAKRRGIRIPSTRPCHAVPTRLTLVPISATPRFSCPGQGGLPSRRSFVRASGESAEHEQFVTREEFQALRSEMYAMFAQLGLRRGVPASYAGGSAALPMAGTPPPMSAADKARVLVDRTTLTPLSRPVAVSLADPSGGPVLSRFSTVLPCPAAPSGTLSGLYLPSFSTNLVSGAALQDAGVHQFAPAGQRVTHCTEALTGRHLATFTRTPGSSLYTLTTKSPPVPASGRVPLSGQVFAAAS